MLPTVVRNAIVAGVALGGLLLFQSRTWLRSGALLVLAVSVGLGLWFRYLIPQDLIHLPAWTGLGAEAALLPLWAVYGALARRAARPWLVGPVWVLAPALGALLGEIPAAALLGAAAPDARSAARLALAAAAGGMISRIGDPALLVLGSRVPHLNLLMLPVAAMLVLVARPRKADLPALQPGSKAVTALAFATALAAAVPGWSLAALGAGTLGMGALAVANRRAPLSYCPSISSSHTKILRGSSAPEAPAAKSGGERCPPDRGVADVGEAASPIEKGRSAGPMRFLIRLRARPALCTGGMAEIAWAVGSVGLVLIAVAAGLADFICNGLESVEAYLGHLPLAALTAASGLAAMLVDAPATGLLAAATLDRAPSLVVEPGLGLALALGAAAGGSGPLVAAGALRHGWWRWLLALALATGWMAALSPWLAPR